MFKTFPEFSKLTLADKAEYEELIKGYPPLSDISFCNLMTWFNTMDTMKVSILNNNLVIPYWIPGFERHCGLSLIGTQDIDDSLCTLFDYLRERGEPPVLANVPDLTISHVKYPELFSFEEDRAFHEYILAIDRFYPLEKLPIHRRVAVERAMKRIGRERIESRSLNLESRDNRNLLLNETESWCDKSINNYGKLELDIMRQNLEHAASLGVNNICFFAEERLLGFCLFERTFKEDYITILHIKATSNNMLDFALLGYLLGEWFIEQSVKYANVNADFGIRKLRMFMLALGPIDFFRKYHVEPA